MELYHSLLIQPEPGFQSTTQSVRKAWKAGDRVDVLDDTTNIYCPGQIVRPMDNGYMVKWLGWDKSYDSLVSDESYIYPPGTFVHKTKAWLKLPKKMGFWPCYLYIRFPKEGSEFGSKNLSYTTLMYVEPVVPDKCNSSLNKFKEGFWSRVWDIVPFMQYSRQKRTKGLSVKQTGKDFQRSLEIIDSDMLTPAHDFELDNSLCIHLDKPVVTGNAPERTVKNDNFNESKHKYNSEGLGTLKRPKSEEQKGTIDEIALKEVMNNVQGMKRRKVDLSWNIQDHFSPYFSELEDKWFQLHADLAAKNVGVKS